MNLYSVDLYGWLFIVKACAQFTFGKEYQSYFWEKNAFSNNYRVDKELCLCGFITIYCAEFKLCH